MADGNPLLALYNFGNRMGQHINKQVELQRHEQVRLHHALAIIAANHQATTLQTQQEHDLGEQANVSAQNRKLEFTKSLMKHVEPGTSFTIKHGDTTVSGTKKTPTPRAAKPPKPKVPPRARS
jgi:hypothetical protein